jgi:dipeptidase E
MRECRIIFIGYNSRMPTIVAMGGGSIGFRRSSVETTPMDKRVVALSRKKHPRVLFIPTASGDSQKYVDVFIKQYEERLGCTVETLLLLRDRPSKKEIAERIKRADIIYVGGGNTLRMMKLWRKLGVDKLLIAAHKRGAICCGLSAGSVCWFREGNSDSRKSIDPAADYIRVKGLGLIDCLHCPHYNSEPDRQPSLKKMMKKIPGVAIALDDCAALIVQGNRMEMLTAKKSAFGRKIYWKNGNYIEEKLTNGDLTDIKI